MKVLKHPVCRGRVRRVPPGFNWVDHRLVRERYIERCDPPAAALYLFLLTVADGQGLSYYSDASLVRSLSLSATRLNQAREDLIRAGLIAYQRPLYQVLALDTPWRSEARKLTADEISTRIGQLRAALEPAP